MNKTIRCVTYLSLLCLPFAPVFATVDDLTVVDYQLVEKKRADQYFFEYTFTMTVSNSGAPLNNVVGTLTSAARTTIVMDDTVALGNVGTGDVQSSDSFKFRQDRRVVFDPTKLFWSFSADDPPVNTAPVADAGPDQGVGVGSLVTLDGSGSNDADMDTLTYAWSLAVPAGSAAILTGAATVAPTFTADVAGDFVATLIVNDATEDSAPDSVTISASVAGANPPSIVSLPVTGGSVNTIYSYEVIATDPDAGDALTYALMQAPAGMSIDAQSGVINWLPAVTGPADVDVVVTDLTGLTDRQIYLILINNGASDQPPTLAPIANQSTIVEQGIMVVALGNDPENEALRYGLPSAPAGMSINTVSGELRWTPALDQSGNFTASVSVTDPGGQTATTSFMVEVLAETPNNPPVIDPVANQSVPPFTPVQLTLSATDEDEGDILIFELSGAPPALQFDGFNGTINWIPSPADAGIASLTATVIDSAGDTDTTTFTITVTEPPFPPVAIDDAYAIDRDLVLQVPADGVLANDIDANNDVLSAANTTLPALGSLDEFPGDGGFQYTPPQNPNITVGLRERCRSAELHDATTVLIGDIDHDGATEVIGYKSSGFNTRIFVMDGADCSLKQPVLVLNSATYGVFPQSTTPALANLDADADLEIILVRTGPPELGINRARMVALNFDGSFVWSLPNGASEAISLPASAGVNYYQNRGPTITDLDGDGSPEILMSLVYDPGAPVFDFLGGIVAYNTDGTIRWEFAGVEQGGASFGKPLYVVDLDLDGTVEVIYHTNVVDHNGNLEFNLQSLAGNNFNPQQLTVAIANFDTDPFPEIVARDTDNLYLFEHTPGPATWTIPYPNSARGEITVGDYDGDGLPEFAFHSGLGSGNNASWMVAFDTDGSLMWSHQGTSYDSTAGTIGWASTAFDYDQDGKDEITVYTRTNGEGEGIFILDGSDGSEIASYTGGGMPHNVLGGFSMFPTIADVDNDGAAEIAYAAATGLGIGPLFILEGLEGNPLPPARSIRNQRIYQPTHVNSDGTVPVYPRPHWLIPGLNMFHGAAVIPFEDPGITDSFHYTASDATATSNEATVTIAVTNVNPPVIVSRPALGASPGFDYLYGLLATDADFGDIFTYTLVDAPAGMTLDSFGLVIWTPNAGDLGLHRVHIVVTDSQGNTDEQSYQISVVPPVIMPDIIGDDLAGASDTLTNAGLAVGSVTQAYSLTVPAGEVISQSVIAGTESAAGAFINFVVSLGPQPIFVPILADVSIPVAQNLLTSVALVLGSVTGANSDTVPAGLVLSQSIAANSQVERDTVVDITVSSGPAVRLELARPLVVAGEILPIVVTVFDNEGVPLSPQPAVNLNVVFESGTVTGTLPVAGNSSITTAVDTGGPFTVVADAGVFGTAQAPFIVRRGLQAGGYYEPIANFMETIDESQRVYTELVTAVANNDFAMIATLGEDLVALRDAIDLERLADRTPFAHETGFIPNAVEAASAGFSASFGELDQLPSIYAGLETALTENRAFLERLDPDVARDDDVRARALNNQLKAKMNQFLSINTSVGGRVFFKTHSYVLLSRSIPALVVANLDASIIALADGGFLNRTADKGPEKPRGGAQRSQIFTLGGLMAGSAVRMTLIKNLYVPHISRLIAAGQLLAEADALRQDSAVGELAGIITGASLSLHIFNAPNSVIEVVGPSTDTRAFSVKLIGPDKFQAWLDAVAEASIPTNLDEFEELITAAADAAAGSLAGTQTAVAHSVIPGCLLSLDPRCMEIVIGFGFPVTHTSGVFPSPVIVILKDIADSKLYVGVYAFFPN